MKNNFLTLSRKETTWSLFYLAFELLLLPGLLIAGAGALGLELSPVLLNFIFYLLNFVFLLLICRNFLSACIRNIRTNLKNILLTAAAALVLYGLIAQGLDLIIRILDPAFENRNDMYLADMAHSQWWLLAVGVVLLVPPAEELLFRGAVFGPLYRRSRILGYGVSMLAFSFIHVMGYVGELAPAAILISLIEYLPAGFFLAWAYRRTGNLFTSILIHSCINIIGVIALR